MLVDNMDAQDFEHAALGKLGKPSADLIAGEIFNMVTGNHILSSVSLYTMEDGRYCKEDIKVRIYPDSSVLNLPFY